MEPDTYTRRVINIVEYRDGHRSPSGHVTGTPPMFPEADGEAFEEAWLRITDELPNLMAGLRADQREMVNLIGERCYIAGQLWRRPRLFPEPEERFLRLDAVVMVALSIAASIIVWYVGKLFIN